MRRTAIHFFLLFAIILLAVPCAPALDVGEVVWGFDGKVVPGRFTLFSALLVNNDRRPFDGMLSLFKSNPLGEPMGEALRASCYLVPGASKWVQFNPYVMNESDEWTLSWGKGPKAKFTLPPPRFGAPAVVFLGESDGVLDLPSGRKMFAENLFPTTVAATDGLHGVVLDHMPRWESVRRQAFMDWVRRGGEVHVIQARDGGFPDFTAELAALNTPLERIRVGAGVVARHPVTRRGVGADSLASWGFAAPELKKSKTDKYYQIVDIGGGIFARLAGLVRPEHSWTTIYSLIAAYLFLLWPVNHFVAWKSRDWRKALVFFLVLVACFGFAINRVGRRGYGEVSTTRTLSYARPAGPGAYDVTQWTNVFAVSGKDYAFRHAGNHNLYAVWSEGDSVNAAVLNGEGGSILVDIPPYSHRSFLHRGRMSGDDLKVDVVDWQLSGNCLDKFALTVGAGFPKDVLSMYVYYRGALREMRRKGDQIELSDAGAIAMDKFLPQDQLTQFHSYPMRITFGEDKKPESGAVFQGLLRPLIAWSLGGTEDFRHRVTFAEPPDKAQLFVFARSPDSFKLKTGVTGDEVGYTLYHITISKPE